MAPPTKPRRFLPQPVEETSRSSRKNNVKHVEDTGGDTKSSRTDLQPIHSDHPTLPGVPNTRPPDAKPRRFAPEPVETSTKSSRRKFAPEPVETSSRSSKDKQKEESSSKPRRKFAPEPVETSARSSKDKREEDTPKPRRKFLPEPVETETKSRRKKDARVELDYSAEDGPAVVSEASSTASSQAPSRTSSGNRKFSPELLETAKGKYRHAVVKSPSKSKHPEPESPPSEREAADDVPPIEESKFSAANLAKKNHEEHRRKSFMVPDLPMIESDSGDDSEAPSLTNSRSSAESELPKAARRTAGGDSYTDYVLRLAAQSATEKELQDQAMAAYINERQHEPVAHYGYDDEDEGPVRVGKLSTEGGVDLRTFRRSSQDDLDWEMQNMRNHHEKLDKMKRDFKNDVAGASRFSAAALVTRHHMERKELKAKKPKADEQSELARMRAAASPPMLGTDLVFPYTISPKMTRCDTDQVPRPRTYDSDGDDEDEGAENQQMWGAKVNVQQHGFDGLWMGMCQRDDEEVSRPTTPIRSGIQTPAHEVANPFDAQHPGRMTPGRRGNQTPGRKVAKLWGAAKNVPLTPPRSADSEDAFTSSIDKKLLLEKQIEEEFPDGVITQIYNYLSLGYPSLAWGFDEELSKISKVTVEELRKDDLNADAKGYVGAPEGDGVDEDDVRGKCKRWDALKLYVREWARQSPGFAAMDGVGQGVKVGKKGAGWGGGAAVRRGSWGH